MLFFFVLIGNPVHNLPKDPMGILIKIILTETTIVIVLKLGMNNHWIALYKTFLFCWYKIQDGCYGRTNWTGESYEENVCNFFSFETLKPPEVNLTRMFLAWPSEPHPQQIYFVMQNILREHISVHASSVYHSFCSSDNFLWRYFQLPLTCTILMWYDYLFNRLT